MPPQSVIEQQQQREYRLKADRQAFLKEHDGLYGYDGRIDQIREREYPQLKGVSYLDHAGTTTYPQGTLGSFHADLSTHLYGNPHSRSPSSQLATDRVNGVRARVLKHFNASPEEYDVIFCANATAAIKMVGEAFPWERGVTRYRYLREGHTSLLGLRRFAEESEASEIGVVTEHELAAEFNPDEEAVAHNPYFHNDIPQVELERDQTDGIPVINNGVNYNLFAYPAQCNFSGMRFPLDWTRKIKQNFNTKYSKTLVLMDAAAYTTTSPLSLADAANSPDFVAVSFYKLFGYPTGLGALILKKELSPILRKRYFGGGTVTTLLYNMTYQLFHGELHERYEDGTINFLNIIALEHAFNTSERLYNGFANVRNHVTSLNSYLHNHMSRLRHWNGSPVCIISSDREFSDYTRQGPILNFNLKRADGSWVGFNEVESLAGVNGIHVRAGAHCNPGSVARWFGVTPEDYANRSCADDQDIVNGKPVGAVRISLGAMTTIDDILVWLDFLKTFFVESDPPVSTFKNIDEADYEIYDEITSVKAETEAVPKLALEKITLYPIKSCHGFEIPPDTSWPVIRTGLLHDRGWMLVKAENGQALSQKRYPRMALIQPQVLLDEGVMLLEAPGQPPLKISLNEDLESKESYSNCSSRVCDDKIDAYRYNSQEINDWFSDFLDVPCILVRQPPIDDEQDHEVNAHRRYIKSDFEASEKAPLSLSNESPFLLVSKSSVDDINAKIRKAGNNEVTTDNFRGNFVIRGTHKYEEDDWKTVQFGSQVFRILGPCKRCNMVTVNQKTAERSNEPYSTLSKHRKYNGNIYFGQHMVHVPELSQAPYVLQPGAPLKVIERNARPIIAARF